MKETEILKTHMKTLIVTTILTVIMLISLSNVSYATAVDNSLVYGKWNGNATSGMPELFYSKSGLFPQILQKRTFTGNADTQFPYQAWTTDMSTGTVYCNDAGATVRYGKYDSVPHYADEAYDNWASFGTWNYQYFELVMREQLRKKAKDDLSIIL